MDLSDLQTALSRPGCLPGNDGPVEVRETHSSLVFLTSDQAFKLKKPVDLGFLDYSTPRRRALMCRREVSLNRRLAPSVYLGVKRLVTLPGGDLAVRDTGRALDFLVHMRRLPDDATLGAIVSQSSDPSSIIERVGHRLATFHEQSPAVADRFGSPAAILRNARANLDEIADDPAVSPAGIGGRIRDYTECFLRDNRALFAKRVAEGRLREGHGDLRCEHIYLEANDELSVIDCVEFSRALRAGDVALDIAFLVMDLTVKGYPDLARQLVGEWEQASGDRVHVLLDFYTCHRAMVRAKVAHMRSRQPGIQTAARETALVDAMAHILLAGRISSQERNPHLIIMSGLPATGKSTVAEVARALTGGQIVVADQVRKELAGLDIGDRAGAEVDTGLYTPKRNAQVYATMLTSARAALRRGRSVVLDATFRRRPDRRAALDLAREYEARVLAVECQAAEPTVRSRLEQRALAQEGWSDATWSTYLAHSQTFDRLTEFRDDEYLAVDSERSSSDIARLLLSSLSASPCPSAANA